MECACALVRGPLSIPSEGAMWMLAEVGVPTLTHTLPEIARVVGLTLTSPNSILETLITDP